ncbi:MAG: carbonic anhydrase family protein [Cyclobacteriaceae bacterium]|jgi:carbonic anhydrase|nr:carbonic anhydrase family protein [Cyclobacteriaceae bacterium]
MEINQEPLVERVLTAEEQQRLTPEEVLQSLKAGNKRFAAGNLTLRDHSKQIRDAVNGQFPKAIILSCIDSRVPVEDVFDKGIGDLFVARVAGNIVNEDILGSMEFSCKVSGAKVVLVIGHEYCGAIKGAIDDVVLGNLTALLRKIKPAVAACAHYAGAQSSKNSEFVDLVIKTNVKLTVANIRLRSAILREMEQQGEITIVGAYYDMDNGEVTFFE